MSFDGFDTDLIVVFGFPLLIVALSMAYAAYQRHLKHKERMAMIERGIAPGEWDDEETSGVRRSRGAGSGISVTLVGVAITLGLLTIGIGPWLIGGLVPTAVGCAMIVQQLMDEARQRREDEQ